jgi:fructose-1,6-bisphosphatase/sedoheptulose 1,7-bisphosphatase-like protein
LKKLSAAGVKIALGTDSGVAATYPGYFELREMIAMADAGMAPNDVIKAADVSICGGLGPRGSRHHCGRQEGGFPFNAE